MASEGGLDRHTNEGVDLENGISRDRLSAEGTGVGDGVMRREQGLRNGISCRCYCIA